MVIALMLSITNFEENPAESETAQAMAPMPWVGQSEPPPTKLDPCPLPWMSNGPVCVPPAEIYLPSPRAAQACLQLVATTMVPVESIDSQTGPASPLSGLPVDALLAPAGSAPMPWLVRPGSDACEECQPAVIISPPPVQSTVCHC